MRYILLGAELKQMLRKLKAEALRHGHKTPVAAPKAFGILVGGVARLWINVLGESNGTLRLSFLNQGTDESIEGDFRSGAETLAPIHQSLGTKIDREVRTDDKGKSWFVTNIRFQWFPGGNV
jgi:hypothetical protein